MLKLKIPPAVLFIIFTGMIWGLDRILPNSPVAIPFKDWVALVVFGIGVIIGMSGVIEFARRSTTVNPHKPENSNELVTSGVYSISRNPMYLGLLLGLLAMLIYQGNVWSAPVLLLFVWYMNEYQIKPEEVIMEEKFTEEFKEYKSQVSRWI